MLEGEDRTFVADDVHLARAPARLMAGVPCSDPPLPA